MGTQGRCPLLRHPPVPQPRGSSMLIPREWGLLQLLRHHQLLCSPKQTKFCLQQELGPSQQCQVPITHLLRARRILWKAPTTRDPDPALPAGDTGSQQRALRGLGASGSIPTGNPRWLRALPSPAPWPRFLPRRTSSPGGWHSQVTVIRNGGSGLAEPAGTLPCFVEAQIPRDAQGLLRRDVPTCAGTLGAELSQFPAPTGDAVPGKQLGHLCSHSCSGICLSGSSVQWAPMNLPWHRDALPWNHPCPPFLGVTAGPTGNGEEWEPPLQAWGKPTHTPCPPLHPTQQPGPPCSRFQ